jgi:multidrug transporter EmrE-like cation transporter
MSWILLIIGGLFGRFCFLWAKRMKQKELNLLIGCWAFTLSKYSMLLLYKATQELPIGLCGLDWY